ncbi:hypothetical protein [Nocardioides sp. SYSU DS0663]|uniref:hypothetical protein n=1 Tax=Nocardioides sp. SYSU DS0663 TaxID=3416445 RepID=UPI003F4C7209
MVTRRLATVLTAVALAVTTLPAGSAPSVADHGQPQSAASAGATGRSFAFRTVGTDRPPRAADTAACRERVADGAGAVLLELTARLVSIRTDRASGRVADAARRRVGSGYLCLRSPEPTALPAEQGGGSSAYGRIRLPGAGAVRTTGWCALVPVVAAPGSALLNCRLAVLPDRRRGVVRGAVTAQVLLDATGASVQESGSLWSAYVERRSWRRPSTQAPAAPEVEGAGTRLSSVLARGRRLPEPPAYDCFGTSHESSLHRVAVRGRTAAVRHGTGRRIGRLLTCTRNFDVNGAMTAAVLVPGPTGDPVELEAEGRCTDRGRPGAVRQRTCELRVLPAPHLGVLGGLVTTLGPALAPVPEIGPGDAPLVTVSLVPIG